MKQQVERSSFIDQDGTKKLYLLGVSLVTEVQEAIAQGWTWKRTIRATGVRLPTLCDSRMVTTDLDGLAVAELERPLEAYLGDSVPE